ncbi:MAG: Kynureninase (L-kynurenine hydrolase) [Thelocarpon superellum]|nr:MAG: Kynureninase (L-kynurenine hydrolase) [Thelocarpon superellum]
MFADSESLTKEYAQWLDEADPLVHFREEFIFPTKISLKSKSLGSIQEKDDSEPCIYLCGNSLGLQPRRTKDRIQAYLSLWAEKAVLGHFAELEESPIPPFVHLDEIAAQKMSRVVGARPDEVAVMETLSANLHLLMSSFYRPDAERYKIIIEGKAFPSDHYAVESQIRNHGLNSADALILIEPTTASDPTLTTAQIVSVIDEHASSTALLLLSGIQYYTGQYFDIPTITAHAQAKGIVVGWDLAHAAGNVELHLHEWNVDFAAWCNYKYLNSGAGSIAGLFVHEKHGKVDDEKLACGEYGYRPRLAGWWGGNKNRRFIMGNKFHPIPGAAGFQVGNPSALDTTAVLASLEIFSSTTMAALRGKSIKLTGYLEHLLLHSHSSFRSSSDPAGAGAGAAVRRGEGGAEKHYSIITPSSPKSRGAQLSIRLSPGLLDGVMAGLEESGVVVDERKPDVIRVAPAPLYNSFVDVWRFVQIFRDVLERLLDR